MFALTANPNKVLMMYFHLLVALLTLKLSIAVTCHPPQGGIFPLRSDCIELINALLHVPHRPGALLTKSWGRDLPNAGGTVHLPKMYWIAAAGPKTCGVLVDNDIYAPHAVERFGLGAIAHAANHILNFCLFRIGEVGMERLGAGKMVIASVIRIDKEGLLRAGGEALYEEAGRNGTVLWSSGLISTGSSAS